MLVPKPFQAWLMLPLKPLRQRLLASDPCQQALGEGALLMASLCLCDQQGCQPDFITLAQCLMLGITRPG